MAGTAPKAVLSEVLRVPTRHLADTLLDAFTRFFYKKNTF